MQITTLAVIAFSTISYFLFAVIALHFLRRDYHLAINFISDFSVGRYGWLMISAFITLAIGSSTLSFALQQALDATNSAKTASILLHVWSMGILFAGVFRTDLQGSKNTTVGILHTLASFLAFLAFTLTVFLFSNLFMQSTQFFNIYPASLTLAITIAITFILFLYTAFFKQDFAGLTQRLFIAAILLWLFFMSFHLL